MEKLPPVNIEAERATLGSILLNREAIIAIAAWLQPNDFYMEHHAWVYDAMLTCYNARIPPDTRTVSEELRRQERLEKIGGVSYLATLVDAVPTSYHIEYYAQIVQRTSLLRRLINAGGKIAALGYDEQEDIETALDKAEGVLFEVSQRRATDDFVHIGNVIDNYYEQINYLQEHHGEVVGIPTGFRDLDEVTGGLQRSDLIILAARPSVGKSSCAMSLAYNVASEYQHTVGVFSLEMGREQLVQRLLAMNTGINTQKLRTGQVREQELQVVMEAMGRLASIPIYIEDTAGLSIMEVRSKCRRLQARTGIDLVIIDYLQLMQGRRSDNRVQEVSEISRGLKALARELNVPIIALSQLSRAVEGRTSHVPMLSDLRESGCLTGDTRVYLPDHGTYQRIDALIGQQGFNVLALNTEIGQLETRQVLRAFATGYKQVYRIQTCLGHTIRATANHQFLSPGGWQRLDMLAPGVPLALPSRLFYTQNHKTTPSVVWEETNHTTAHEMTLVHTAAVALPAHSAVHWDEINSIEFDGVESVYDLTVEGLHNFVANDMIVHNSIEQDADIVIFIYREELYDKETDKKGIAELHIAKHRNGPTAVIPMRFDASTTRYLDLSYRTPDGY